MAAATCLYRRPSGIYVFRLAVPLRLRALLNKTEVHVSTKSRDIASAKFAALQIEYRWRERFMALDLQRLATKNPLLADDGLVPIVEAAKLIGLSVETLLLELQQACPSLHTVGENWRGLLVKDTDAIDREPGGGYILNSVESLGDASVLNCMCRSLPEDNVPLQLLSRGQATPSCFATEAGHLFWPTNEVTISASAWFATKSVVERIRQRLHGHAQALQILQPPQAPSTITPHVQQPSLTTREQKRFSEVFDAYKQHKTWGKAQANQMATEAGLFIDVMNDPMTGDIHVESIHEFSSRLASLPTDIYQARRKYGKDASIDDLIELARQDNLPTKSEQTIKGHISRVAEILNFAVSPGDYMPCHPTPSAHSRSNKR